jgi:hypothetical protein
MLNSIFWEFIYYQDFLTKPKLSLTTKCRRFADIEFADVPEMRSLQLRAEARELRCPERKILLQAAFQAALQGEGAL